MRIEIEADEEFRSNIYRIVEDSEENMELIKKNSVTGQEIIEIIITYGPAAIELIKRILDLYEKIKNDADRRRRNKVMIRSD